MYSENLFNQDFPATHAAEMLLSYIQGGYAWQRYLVALERCNAMIARYTPIHNLQPHGAPKRIVAHILKALHSERETIVAHLSEIIEQAYSSQATIRDILGKL